MRKFALLIILEALVLCYFIVSLNQGPYPLLARKNFQALISLTGKPPRKDALISSALELLKFRKDRDAYSASDHILIFEPDNIDALWIKAEVLRRQDKYAESRLILQKILKADPGHNSALISLAYIYYNDKDFAQAQRLIQRVLASPYLERENMALANLMLGAIHSGLAKNGMLLSKLKYGLKIKNYFLKAQQIAPDLPETHLGLGTFYLVAPVFIGGNLQNAISELENAVAIAPEFATACARLAQAYKAKKNLVKYNFYLNKARALEPKNEVLKEIGS